MLAPRPSPRGAPPLRRGPAPAPARLVAAAAGRKPSSSSSDSDGDAAPPPRIIDTRRMSLKTQKRLVEAIKTSTTAGSSSSASQVARKFRRPKPDPAVVAAARAEEEARDKAARGTSIALRGLYGSRGDDHPPVLLVDGYNVAFHAAAGYASAPSGGGDASSDGVDLDGARQKLLLDMCEYGAVAGLRVVVAWDALANPAAKGLDRARVAGVDVVYCGDREADTLLVQEAARLVETGCPRVLVATSDREVQTGLDWTKVGFVPAGVLLKEMRRALAAADRAYKARAAVAKAAGPRLGGSLRGGQVDALRALKAKLMEEGKGGSFGVGGKKK